MKQQNYLKCVFLGDISVGKSSLLTRIIENKFHDKCESTIGAAFRVKQFEFKHNNHFYEIKIHFWDTAGQERYNSLVPMYYKNSDIIMILYDISQDHNHNHSFVKARTWLYKILKNDPSCIINFIGNKYDLIEKENIIHEQYINNLKNDIKKIYKDTNVSFYHCSAKNSMNIQKIMDDTILMSIQKKNSKCTINDSINQLSIHSNFDNTKKNYCC